MKIISKTIIASMLTLVSACVIASNEKSPNCTQPEGYASSMAYTHLKNEGIIQSGVIDNSKTTVERIASEKIGKDLYRQVHRVAFYKKSGEKIDVISVNDASHEECSMSGVDIYIVSKKIGDM